MASFTRKAKAGRSGGSKVTDEMRDASMSKFAKTLKFTTTTRKVVDAKGKVLGSESITVAGPIPATAVLAGGRGTSTRQHVTGWIRRTGQANLSTVTDDTGAVYLRKS